MIDSFAILHSPRLWIQLFHSALNAKGRAGAVMANSASDARASEQEIRQKLIESRAGAPCISRCNGGIK